MNRKQAKELLPIIQAFAEGKTVQCRTNNTYDWVNTNTPSFNPGLWEYRIKPEPTYRPFKNAEECWQQMLRHEPFGWVKDKKDEHGVLITVCEDNCVFMGRNEGWFFKDIMNLFTFADGTPFGVKVEE